MNSLPIIKKLLRTKQFKFLLRHQFILLLLSEYILTKYMARLLKIMFPRQKQKIDKLNAAIITLFNVATLLKKKR